MKIGFIGIGNMGGAILRGYSKVAAEKGNQVLAYDRDLDKLKLVADETGITPEKSIELLMKKSDVVLLCVKPNIYESLLEDIKDFYSDEKTIISIAAGISIGFIEKYLGDTAKIVRIMPNTPALVGVGMTAITRNKNVEDDTYIQIQDIFEGIGLVGNVDEEDIDCVIGVSGSSPAYTYMYIEALIKAAVKNGMDEKQAKVFAAQSVMGAAKMVMESDDTPEQLRINVCSPGGTTIEAVNKLFENGFEENVVEAFQAAVDKSKEMTK